MSTISTISPLFTTDCRGKVFSPNYGGNLLVAQRGWPRGTDVDSILDGSAPAERVFLSADGKAWAAGWHEGPEAEAIYVERHERGGSSFHGYVDSVSRRIVQAG